jgi:hypothetical protein
VSRAELIELLQEALFDDILALYELLQEASGNVDSLDALRDGRDVLMTVDQW